MATTQETKNEAKSQWEAERKELIELCKNLGQVEWSVQSMCEGWRVRDVVAHLVGVERELWIYFTATPNNANQKQVDRRTELSTKQLVEQLEDTLLKPGFLTRRFPKLALYDMWVHQQDIRWSLGRERQQDPERLKMVLDTISGRAIKNLAKHNQKLIATDIDWQLGEGSEIIRGKAEVLAMFLAGRREAALARL